MCAGISVDTVLDYSIFTNIIYRISIKKQLSQQIYVYSYFSKFTEINKFKLVLSLNTLAHYIEGD